MPRKKIYPKPPDMRLKANRKGIGARKRELPDWIPVDRFMPFVNKYIEQEREGLDINDNTLSGIIGIICERSGIKARAFYRWRSGETKYVRFEDVDKLLIACFLEHLWYTELYDIYAASLKEDTNA